MNWTSLDPLLWMGVSSSVIAILEVGSFRKHDFDLPPAPIRIIQFRLAVFASLILGLWKGGGKGRRRIDLLMAASSSAHRRRASSISGRSALFAHLSVKPLIIHIIWRRERRRRRRNGAVFPVINYDLAQSRRRCRRRLSYHRQRPPAFPSPQGRSAPFLPPKCFFALSAPSCRLQKDAYPAPQCPPTSPHPHSLSQQLRCRFGLLLSHGVRFSSPPLLSFQHLVLLPADPAALSDARCFSLPDPGCRMPFLPSPPPYFLSPLVEIPRNECPTR